MPYTLFFCRPVIHSLISCPVYSNSLLNSLTYSTFARDFLEVETLETVLKDR